MVLALLSIFANRLSILQVLAGTVTDFHTLDITAVVPSLTPPGGGGGTGSVPAASVTISGFSFPDAKLTLLKDGQVITTLIANHDGTFVVVVNSLNFGNYQFSVIAEDSDGVQSSPYVINVPVFNVQGYVYNGIVLPPTIRVNPLVVENGQPTSVFGYAAPGANVLVGVPGQFNFGSAIADTNGFYQFEVRQILTPGNYFFRTQAQVGGVTSPYSKPVLVLYYGVGQTPPPLPSQLAICVDYNHDGRVNLIDFSILLFWFNKTNPPTNIDCNRDNAIDIKDFSILMYFWTG